jgi:hypothetical protein
MDIYNTLAINVTSNVELTVISWFKVAYIN